MAGKSSMTSSLAPFGHALVYTVNGHAQLQTTLNKALLNNSSCDLNQTTSNLHVHNVSVSGGVHSLQMLQMSLPYNTHYQGITSTDDNATFLLNLCEIT